MKLSLNGIVLSCIIGDLPEERIKPQPLRVDVELELGEAAVTSDELADTVDYAALKERIVAALQAACCRLIERAAGVVREVCLAEPGVVHVRVRVTKTGAIAGLESAQAEIEG